MGLPARYHKSMSHLLNANIKQLPVCLASLVAIPGTNQRFCSIWRDFLATSTSPWVQLVVYLKIEGS
jgi:hypothetical protein